MKVLFLALITVFASTLVAQTKYNTVSENFISYHENISVAERMFKNDSLLQAYARFDMAIQNYKGAINPGHYFRAALCAIKIKEEFKALDYLEKAITNGYEVDSSKKDAVVFFKDFQHIASCSKANSCTIITSLSSPSFPLIIIKIIIINQFI